MTPLTQTAEWRIRSIDSGDRLCRKQTFEQGHPVRVGSTAVDGEIKSVRLTIRSRFDSDQF